jgi:glycosyltransferase involved in cell wall biosynthesis
VKPLRVLHVVHSLDPGGMENGVSNLACGLVSRGIETHVACLEHRGAFADRLPTPGNVRVLGKSVGFSLLATLRLAILIARLRPVVVHSHNLGPLIYAALATLHGRTAALVQGEHAHLLPWEKTPRRLAQRLRYYRICHTVHTVAPAMSEELAVLGLRARELVTIENGVDTERFVPANRAAARRALGLPADALLLGLVGRFGPYKGHRTLLDAFDSLAVQHPRCALLLIGAGGSEESAIRQRATASPQRDRIHFAGFQSNPVPYYQALDFLVVPSTNEGMSNAVLEAMACGIPALGNFDCGHESLLTPDFDGFLADLRTAESLTHALDPLLRAPQRLVDTGAHARTTVARRFSLARMLDAYDHLYRSAASAAWIS